MRKFLIGVFLVCSVVIVLPVLIIIVSNKVMMFIVFLIQTLLVILLVCLYYDFRAAGLQKHIHPPNPYGFFKALGDQVIYPLRDNLRKN